VDACRAAGLRVGLYFSFADWHHQDYPGAYCRDWPTGWKDEASRQRFIDYSHGQVRELLSNYGKIDILWWDGCIPEPTGGAGINEEAKRLQPGILINPSNGEPCDFGRSEQKIVADPDRPWEACMTLNDNWGYHAGDFQYRSPKQVIGLLVQAASQGGNLLLNVGPKADGTIPEPSIDILRESGDWLHRNYEWLPDSGRSPFKWNNCCVLSVKEDKVYLHFQNNVPESPFCLAEISNKVISARYLDGGQSIEFEQKGTRLFLKNLPDQWTDPLYTTIELQVEGTPSPVRDEGNSWIID
jgi:alpha-L-fucosidase